MPGFDPRRPKRNGGAAWTCERDFREFRLDALAELEPDLTWRGHRSADRRGRLVELGVGEGGGRNADEGKRCDSANKLAHHHHLAPVAIGVTRGLPTPGSSMASVAGKM